MPGFLIAFAAKQPFFIPIRIEPPVKCLPLRRHVLQERRRVEVIAVACGHLVGTAAKATLPPCSSDEEEIRSVDAGGVEVGEFHGSLGEGQHG